MKDPQLQYTWEVTAGRINATGSAATWDFSGVQPGSYTASVRVSSGASVPSVCSVQVIVLKHEGERGPRETGGSFLVQDAHEAPGFGLYSYLLFGSPPDEASRDRYLQAVRAYLSLIPDIVELEKYLQRPDELNVTYLPLQVNPPDRASAEWVLEHYNYPRARIILKSLGGNHRDGPYIISSLKPLNGISTFSDHYLYQDLSSVPPHLISAWVKEYMNEAAQERFWQQQSAQRLVLKMRTTIGILAVGLPDVRKGLDEWIAWTR